MARQKDAKRIMKRKERKEDGVKFPRRARVWGSKILAEEGTSVENKRWSETKDGAGMSRGRSQKRKRERERLAKKDFSKDPLGSNVAFIGLLSAKHWSRAPG